MLLPVPLRQQQLRYHSDMGNQATHKLLAAQTSLNENVLLLASVFQMASNVENNKMNGTGYQQQLNSPNAVMKMHPEAIQEGAGCVFE